MRPKLQTWSTRKDAILDDLMNVFSLFWLKLRLADLNQAICLVQWSVDLKMDVLRLKLKINCGIVLVILDTMVIMQSYSNGMV